MPGGVLAESVYDLMTSPDAPKQTNAELVQRQRPNAYESLVEPVQKPSLDYRKAYQQ